MVERKEQDSVMNPDMHAVFLPDFVIFTSFLFSCEFSVHWWRPMLAIEHTRGMASFEVPIFLLSEFRIYLAGVPQCEPHGEGDLSAFFWLSTLLFLLFFFSLFFQSFWHEQCMFYFQVYHRLVVFVSMNPHLIEIYHKGGDVNHSSLSCSSVDLQ